MTIAFKKWAYGLGAGAIGGSATALSAALGLGAAQAVGIQVHALDLKQLGFVALMGVISNGVLYLKQSPLPPMESDTDYFREWQSKKGTPETEPAKPAVTP